MSQRGYHNISAHPDLRATGSGPHSLQPRCNVIQLISVFLITEVNFIYFCKVTIGFKKILLEDKKKRKKEKTCIQFYC